jgi:endo-1,4-beta-xylanase
MLARLESYIKQVLTYTQTEYPGIIYCWDVVNEAVENSAGAYETESGFQIRSYYDGNKENLWYKVIGVDYVEKSFEYARKYAAPEVKLYYNDYNTFQPSKTLLIYNLASSLKEKGLIDGIGMQGYMDLTYPGIAGGQDSFMTALSKFAELGLEIQLTELTIRSDDKNPESMEKQAKRYESLFQILKGMDTASGKNANITAVTVFGLMDEYLFYTNDKTYARLFDGKLQPKPAFYSILGVTEKK